MILYSVIFEKGVEIKQEDDGLWYFQSSPEKISVASPKEVSKKYGLRPILMKCHGYSGEDVGRLLPLKGTEVLGFQLSKLHQAASPKKSHIFFGTLNLSYVVESVHYHCRRLCEVYSNICRLFVESTVKIIEEDVDAIGLGGELEPYFEFEALVTSALRAYNTTRYIIWTAFGPGKGSVPASFKKTLPLCNSIPRVLKKRLDSSWQQYGKQVQAYRDCVQHYVSIGGLLPTVQMTKLKGDVWSTSAWIPDNPGVKSDKKFTYSLKIDALKYAWKITNEILEISNMLVEAVPEQTETK